MPAPTVVLDFLGSYWTTHRSEVSTIESNLNAIVGNAYFWSRYSQYGVSQGSALGDGYIGELTAFSP